MLILSDIDGVVLNWHDGYCRYYDIPLKTATGYDDDKFTVDRINAFNATPEFGQLTVMREADHVIRELYGSRAVDVIMVSSALPTNVTNEQVKEITRRRTANIGRATRVICPTYLLPLRGDKVPMYRQLAYASSDRNVIVVEDHYDTAMSVADTVPGCTVLIMEHPYNNSAEQKAEAKSKNIRYVHDWYGISSYAQQPVRAALG